MVGIEGEVQMTNLDPESGEVFGCLNANPKYCYTCEHRNGPAPWANGPEKSYCEIYTRENSRQKPSIVYFEGAECPFYTEEE